MRYWIWTKNRLFWLIKYSGEQDFHTHQLWVIDTQISREQLNIKTLSEAYRVIQTTPVPAADKSSEY